MKKGCIVGYGAVGPIHEAALLKMGCEYAVCDCDERRLSQAKTEERYTDFEKLLCEPSIDVVHICTPHYLHVQMAEAALDAGKKVILEKPVGINPDEVNRLFERKSDVCIMLQNRKNPQIMKMKEIIDSGKYGKIQSMCAFVTWRRDREYYARDAWRGKWSTEGGGLLINQAIHTLDLLCYLGGGYVSLRGGISTRCLGDVIEVEDTADAIIKTVCGVSACFYATNCSAINNPVRIEVQLRDALLRYSDDMLTLVKDNTVSILVCGNTDTPGKSYWGSGHLDVIREFYDYLDGKSDTYLKLENARDVTRALFDFYK